MTEPSRSNLYIGLFFMVFAVLAIFLWIPLDTETGIVEKTRRRLAIGDALAPTLACVFLLIGGVLLVTKERLIRDQPGFQTAQIGFILRIVGIIAVGLLIMRFAGPLIAQIATWLTGDPVEYRLLRATLGWKHIGFVTGGGVIVAGMVSVVERQFSWRAVLTAFVAVVFMILVFDVPFEDLLLPPNGDV